MPDPARPVLSPTEQFRAAIEGKGLTPPDSIEADGQIHHFSSNGRPGDKKGWYVYREGTVPTGSFGDFRTGVNVKKWSADIGRALTGAERREFAEKQKAASAEQRKSKEQRYEEAQAKAERMVGAAVRAGDNHPYLLKKKIGAHGLLQWPNAEPRIYEYKGRNYLELSSPGKHAKVSFAVDLEEQPPADIIRDWGNVLLIPMQDNSGEIKSVQFISKSGEKKFLAGGKMQGSYFPIGDLQGADIVLVAEGYATAATIHEITGHPVVVAYNAGNLLEVSKSIRMLLPDAQIHLCADDDWKTKGNPGLTKAMQAAEAVNGEMIVPLFGDKRPDKATDFNDWAALEGKDAVTRFFTRHFSATEEKPMSNVEVNYDEEQENEVYIANPGRRDRTYQAPPQPKKVPYPANDRSYEPITEPAYIPHVHFDNDDFQVIQKIWKGVPHRTAYHTENGYHLLVDETRKVIVRKDRIELAKKPRHRTDQTYVAACAHAREFWGGRMEVQGDTAHRVKAWAFANVYGIEVTNYSPNDTERLEAEKIMAALRKEMQPAFSRPSARPSQGPKTSTRLEM